jgi:hypothetical protein
MPGPAPLNLTRETGLEIYRGEKPYFVDLTFPDYDFAGCNGKAQVKDRSGNLLFEFAVTFPEADVCRISYADTETLSPIKGAVWDLFITYSNGDIQAESGGSLDVVDRVTDRD